MTNFGFNFSYGDPSSGINLPSQSGSDFNASEDIPVKKGRFSFLKGLKKSLGKRSSSHKTNQIRPQSDDYRTSESINERHIFSSPPNMKNSTWKKVCNLFASFKAKMPSMRKPKVPSLKLPKLPSLKKSSKQNSDLPTKPIGHWTNFDELGDMEFDLQSNKLNPDLAIKEIKDLMKNPEEAASVKLAMSKGIGNRAGELWKTEAGKLAMQLSCQDSMSPEQPKALDKLQQIDELINKKATLKEILDVYNQFIEQHLDPNGADFINIDSRFAKNYQKISYGSYSSDELNSIDSEAVKTISEELKPVKTAFYTLVEGNWQGERLKLKVPK